MHKIRITCIVNASNIIIYVTLLTNEFNKGTTCHPIEYIQSALERYMPSGIHMHSRRAHVNYVVVHGL